MCELEAALLRLQELAASHPDEIFRIVPKGDSWAIEVTFKGRWHTWMCCPGAGVTLPSVINNAVDEAVDRFKTEAIAYNQATRSSP